MAIQIQLRNDTAANWTAANPILAVGEMGVETDNGNYKIGDGVTAWTSLSYGGADGASAYDVAVANGFVGTEEDWLISLQGADGVGVPAGGTEGQVLAKATDGDYETVWVNQSGGSGGSGEKLIVMAKNYTGTAISAFTPVVNDNSDGVQLAVKPFPTNGYGTPAHEFVGITTADIDPGQEGEVVMHGLIPIDVNVFGNNNSKLYIDPQNGTLSPFAADQINWRNPIGYISSNINSGQAFLYVIGADYNQNIFNHNGMNIDFNNVQNGQILYYNNGWLENGDPPSGGGGGGNGGVNPNLILNSDFRINQEYGNLTHQSGAYIADQWKVENIFGDKVTVPLNATDLAAIDANVTHKAFFAADAGSPRLITPIEDVRTVSDGPVTLSFWYKFNDTNAGSLNPEIVQVFDSTDLEQYHQFPGTSTAAAAGQWVKYVGTANLPSLDGKTIGDNSHLKIRFNFNISSSEGIHITGVKLEAGENATDYVPMTPTYGTELAACQRYFYYWNSRDAVYAFLEMCFALNSDLVDCGKYYPVEMRTAPTVSFSGSDWEQYGGAASPGLGAITPSAFQPTTTSVTYRWSTPGNAVTGASGKMASLNTNDAWIKHDARINI